MAIMSGFRCEGRADAAGRWTEMIVLLHFLISRVHVRKSVGVSCESLSYRLRGAVEVG